MVLQYDNVLADAIGTTIGAEETIGTITFNEFASRMLAILVQVVGTGVKTTAEGNIGTLIVESSDLDVVNYEFPTDRNAGAAPGTNIGSSISPMQVLIFDTPVRPKNTITFKYDAKGPEPTEESAAQVTVVYDDGSTPQEIVDILHSGAHLPKHEQAKFASDDEIGDAVSEVLDSVISVEGKFGTIVGYKAVVSPDAVPTANEHFLGHIEWTGTVSKQTPMKTPLPAISTALGTPVGIAVQPLTIELPMWLPKSTSTDTFTPTAVLQQVTSGAHAVNVGLLARR